MRGRCVLIVAAIVVALASASAFAGYADAVAADGPVAWWRLSETTGA